MQEENEYLKGCDVPEDDSDPNARAYRIGWERQAMRSKIDALETKVKKDKDFIRFIAEAIYDAFRANSVIGLEDLLEDIKEYHYGNE